MDGMHPVISSMLQFWFASYVENTINYNSTDGVTLCNTTCFSHGIWDVVPLIICNKESQWSSTMYTYSLMDGTNVLKESAASTFRVKQYVRVIN